MLRIIQIFGLCSYVDDDRYALSFAPDRLYPTLVSWPLEFFPCQYMDSPTDLFCEYTALTQHCSDEVLWLEPGTRRFKLWVFASRP